MHIKFFISLLLTLVCSITFAAKPVVAPTKHLTHQRNQVSVIKVNDVLSENRFVFEKVADLWGEGPTKFEIRLERKSLNEISVGQQLIVGYSDQIRRPIVRDIRKTDPLGYRVLPISVADYALFSDSKSLRYLFLNKDPKTDTERQAFVHHIINEMQHRDAQNSALAMFEFNMRPDLYAHLSRNNIKQLQTLVNSNKLSDELHEILLSSTMSFPKNFSGDWVAENCRGIFKNYGAQFDLVTFRPLLVKTCARLLSRFGSTKDIDALSGMLFSNSPGVAKSAIRTINQLSSDTMIKIAKQTYKSKEVHLETRKVLEQFAKR